MSKGDKSQHILIVRVNMRQLKRYRKKPDEYMDTPKNLEAIYNKAQALDFEGDIMSFVIDHVKETKSAYNVLFEGQAFRLDKRNLKDHFGQRWFRYNEVFEFRLCETLKIAIFGLIRIMCYFPLSCPSMHSNKALMCRINLQADQRGDGV